MSDQPDYCEFCEIDGFGSHAPRCPVALEAQLAECRRTIALFASVIKSGESWSDVCQQAYDAAFVDKCESDEHAAEQDTDIGDDNESGLSLRWNKSSLVVYDEESDRTDEYPIPHVHVRAKPVIEDIVQMAYQRGRDDKLADLRDELGVG